MHKHSKVEMLRNKSYRLLMKLLRIDRDFRGGIKPYIGVCPYPRRSPLLLTLFNLQEIWRYFRDTRPTNGILQPTKTAEFSKNGRQALILGNGPSLNKLNSAAVIMSQPDVWVVNSFYKVEYAKSIQVTHYVISDRTHFTSENHYVEIINFINQREDLTLVLPHWSPKEFPGHPLFQFRHLFFDDRQKAAWSRNTSPMKPRGYLSLTLYKALGFANYLGYQEIFILGLDNTEFIGYASNANNEFVFSGNHAYVDPKTRRDFSADFLDGPAGAFIDVAHSFADLYRFKGPFKNLDTDSLSTAFPKTINHPWTS